MVMVSQSLGKNYGFFKGIFGHPLGQTDEASEWSLFFTQEDDGKSETKFDGFSTQFDGFSMFSS